MGLIKNRDAQFMLLAGFIIAVGLVLTTVMLNSVIFEGNMAVESGNDPSKNDIINLMQITKDETGAAYRNVTNGSASNASMIINNFIYQKQNFTDNLSTIYVVNGEGVNLNWNISNWNNSNYAYFTDNGMANGTANWALVQNVSSSNITVNVTTGAFYINITNSTNYIWQINLTNSNPQNRTISNSQISLNVTQPYTISFINGTNATGRFNITGIASGRVFTRARDYILYANITFSTGRMKADITIPISVPW